MFIVIILLIVMAGGLLYVHFRKSPAKAQGSKVVSSAQNKVAPGPNPAQYAGWQSFCSSYGGLCLKYPSTWRLTQASYTPGQNSSGQEVDTITSPSGKVKVVYMPSAQVTGVRRTESISVANVLPAEEAALEAVQLIDHLNTSPAQYAVEDFVTLVSAAHALNSTNTPFMAGSTIVSAAEPPYHQFTNPERPGDIGQQLLAVTESGGLPDGNLFASVPAAQNWLSGAEVKTANQILTSVTYSQ